MSQTQPVEKLVDVKDLKTYFKTEAGIAKAVDGVTFEVRKGEMLGIVGESGSGKSVTSLSLIRLIPNPPGFIAGGEVLFGGRDLLKLPLSEMYKIRGKEIAMIFQEPMTSLNPVFTIGMQVEEIVRFHDHVAKEQVFEHAVKMLEQVGIPDAAKRMKDYPHQYSGGMRQRVMIAMALACDPQLLIADEPTTALDVTIQAQILDLMIQLKERRPGAAIMLITHDLAVIAETCQRVIVMYGGVIQEMSDVVPLFEEPLHPYTIGLLRSLPRPDIQMQKRLYNIPGTVPSIINLPKGCKFSNRCDRVMPICSLVEPLLAEVAPGRWVRCHLYEGSRVEVPGVSASAIPPIKAEDLPNLIPFAKDAALPDTIGDRPPGGVDRPPSVQPTLGEESSPQPDESAAENIPPLVGPRDAEGGAFSLPSDKETPLSGHLDTGDPKDPEEK